jgi:acyl-CoA synthetase (AMP-forming)/AMP-acid ligase II
LDDQSSALASTIKTHLTNSLYIVVLLPQGLEFIITILAIFKAGKIAVPCSIPKQKNGTERLLAILEDSGSKDIICSKIETSRIKLNDKSNSAKFI